ncbi:peptidoglycan-binding protein [Gymnodinialimonas sp. 2305UL16-5]|uniref:peptidoglycan-binding protein n=1 Tax=Gymnodinialimonas mytili TaxID=3126503 RepID=UPI0030AAEC2E
MRARFFAISVWAGAFLGGLSSSVSADTALLIVNDRYSAAQNLREGREIEALRRPLEEAGFDVILTRDADGDDMRDALAELLDIADEDRVLIAAIGHFARSSGGNWLLGSDARRTNLAQVGGDGLDLDVMMEVAARVPGRSIVLLGQERRRIDLGAGLNAGLGQIAPPQGVTAVVGAPSDLADLVSDVLLVPGANLPGAINGSRGLRGYGFLSASVPFLGSEGSDTPQVLPPAPILPQASGDELALWNAAVELANAAAYRRYLERYPNGAYAAQARAEIAALEADPTSLAEAAEEVLQLDREARREIQRDLAILGHYDRGIDGVLGDGSRAAIVAWQASAGYDQTGYLDAGQITALSSQADIRAAEIEAQEVAALAEAERADRAYWQVTGQGATERGLRQYLDRYPNGQFAGEAARRLVEYDELAWNDASAADNVPGYEAYLRDYPQGEYANAARHRIAQLTGQVQPWPNAPTPSSPFAQQETALNLPPVTRSILEQRLAALGLNPGRIDGRFDNQTRSAIANFQQSRGLQVTGFFDSPTVAQLLENAFGGIIQLEGVFR